MNKIDRVEPQVITTLPMAAGKIYAITLEEYRTLERVFAEVDVAAELRIMQQWCETHPSHRHRLSDCVRRWIIEWLTRARSRTVVRELLMPFGRYRGERLELVAQDDGYCRWLFAQPWFATDHPTIAAKLLELRRNDRGSSTVFWSLDGLLASAN